MDVKIHIQSIKDSVANGKTKSAIDKLQFLADKSPRLNEILLQKANNTQLERLILNGTISFEEENIAKNKINQAILDLADLVEKEVLESEEVQSQIKNTVDEFIRKFDIEQTYIDTHNNRLKQGDKKYNLLWVDDDPDNDTIELSMLSALDIRCRLAKDPYEAYKLIKEETPNIIIVNSLSRLRDYEQEGIEFCRFLSQKDLTRNIPVLMHSISLQKDFKDTNGDLGYEIPSNVKNDLGKRNTLVIKVLIEEILKYL